MDAERTSLRTYQALYDRTREKDPVTAVLALEYLAAVVRGEEEPIVTESQTLDVQRILDACYRSSTEAREVKVDER